MLSVTVSCKNFAERTVDPSPATLIENHATYHRICYSNYTNKGKIDVARKRYREAVETGATSVVKRKAGRPSLNNSNELEKYEGLNTRSRRMPYMKTFASFVKSKVGSIIESSLKLRSKYVGSLQNAADKSFFRRLPSRHLRA